MRSKRMTNTINWERYDRNILIERIGNQGQNKLLNSKVLIAGAGGLGSSVIALLASVGIGTIGIIDNDVLEISNLNRQFIHIYENIGKSKVNSAKEWITKYNPDIKVNIYQIRLNGDNCNEILSDYDLVLDCFDSFESKFTLNKTCIKAKKVLIHGGVTEFYGQVTNIIPGKTACLNCLFPDSLKNLYTTKGVISPAVGTIGSIQAMEAVKTLLGFEELLTNSLFSYDGINQTFRKIEIKQNTNCPVCGATRKERCSDAAESSNI